MIGDPISGVAGNRGRGNIYLADKRVEARGHPPVYVPESAFPENQYYFWPRYDENEELPPGAVPKDEYYTEESGVSLFVGRSALYITDRAEERATSAIKDGFERVEGETLGRYRQVVRPVLERDETLEMDIAPFGILGRIDGEQRRLHHIDAGEPRARHGREQPAYRGGDGLC